MGALSAAKASTSVRIPREVILETLEMGRKLESIVATLEILLDGESLRDIEEGLKDIEKGNVVRCKAVDVTRVLG